MGSREEGREHSGPSGSRPSIPAPLTALIGRTSELEAVSDALRRSRLVTLTGPAGVGKTRTAVELGVVRRGVGGCAWLVDLASVAAPEDVDICARLDHLPLAIELAAARVSRVRPLAGG